MAPSQSTLRGAQHQAFIDAIRKCEGDVNKILPFIEKDPFRHDPTRCLVNTARETRRPDDKGSTALILAAYFGYYEVCRVLLENHADPLMVCKAPRGTKRGAVYWAGVEGCIEALKVLLEWLVDPKKKYLGKRAAQDELLATERAVKKMDTFAEFQGVPDELRAKRKQEILDELQPVCADVRVKQRSENRQPFWDSLEVSVFFLQLASVALCLRLLVSCSVHPYIVVL